MGTNTAAQHHRPLEAGAAVQQGVVQLAQVPAKPRGGTSVMDAIAMIQRAYGHAESDAESEGVGEDHVEAEAHPTDKAGEGSPPRPQKKADEGATYKIFMPPPPKPADSSGLGFNFAMTVKSKKYGKKPAAPGMELEDPEEVEQQRRAAEQAAIRERILAAQEAKRKQEEEDRNLAELEGGDDGSATALNLLASAAGLSATVLARMLEKRKLDDPNNQGLLAWAKAFQSKTKKQISTLEGRLRLDKGMTEETVTKCQEEVARLKALVQKLKEWEADERKRRREMDEAMKEQLRQQAEAEKQRLAQKRIRIQKEREEAKARILAEKRRRADEARAAKAKRRAEDAAAAEARKAAKAAELERKRAKAAQARMAR